MLKKKKKANTKQKGTCKLIETQGKGEGGFVCVRAQQVIWIVLEADISNREHDAVS